MTDGDSVKVLDGNTFLVSGRNGDVEPSPTFPNGLFAFDTRFLSTWRLTVDGGPLHPLSVDDLQYYEIRFFLAPNEPTPYVDAKLSVIRTRWIGGSVCERVTILNHQDQAVELAVRIDAASDFSDIFGVKNVSRPPVGDIYAQAGNGRLVPVTAATPGAEKPTSPATRQPPATSAD